MRQPTRFGFKLWLISLKTAVKRIAEEIFENYSPYRLAPKSEGVFSGLS